MRKQPGSVFFGAWWCKIGQFFVTTGDKNITAVFKLLVTLNASGF